MPNHVINEIVIEGDAALFDRVLAKVSTEQSPIDFEGLLPSPLNAWRYGQSTKHEKAFPIMEMDWTRANWGTKWNAYGLDEGGKYQSVVRTDNRLVLTFQTAWGAPMGWLLALHNQFKLPFSYGYLSEGGSSARVGWFKVPDNWAAEPWDEKDATPEQGRRLHKLLWGVERFEDEPAE